MDMRVNRTKKYGKRKLPASFLYGETLLCLADHYNREPDRHYSEFSTVELKKRIRELLK